MAATTQRGKLHLVNILDKHFRHRNCTSEIFTVRVKDDREGLKQAWSIIQLENQRVTYKGQ